ncbi:MAG: beta-ketoacyl synthase N-terminal-like domain-containing protein [Caulobacterales bacterium]
MPGNTIYLRGIGNYYAPVEDKPAELKALVKEATGDAVRRVGRFIQMALVGAGRCVAGRKLPPETGVYFTSGRGDLEVTIEVMEELFRDGHPPKPLNFINTVSNAACFYVAKQFGLHGRSTFLGNSFFSFETALQLAMLDLELGDVKSALVGSVDIVVPPVELHRRRLKIAPETPVAEGAHWLWLSAEKGEGARGAVQAAEFFTGRDALIAWVAKQDLNANETLIAAGQFLSDADLAEIKKASGLTRDFAYRDSLSYYDSQSGAAVAAFLESKTGEVLLHVNADPDGRCAAFIIRK